MKKIKNISLPETWNEVTVGQMITFQDHYTNPDFEEYKQLAKVCAMANLSLDQVKKMNADTVTDLARSLTWMDSEKIKETPVGEFEHQGHKYYCAEILQNQFQDIWALSQLTQGELNYRNLPKIVAIAAKRKGETLDTPEFDLTTRANEFMNLPMTTAYSVYIFFCQVINVSAIDWQQVLEKQSQLLVAQIKFIRSTIKKQVGTGLYTRFVKMMLRAFLKYLEHRWIGLYSTWNKEILNVSLKEKFKTWFTNIIKRKVKSKAL